MSVLTVYECESCGARSERPGGASLVPDGWARLEATVPRDPRQNPLEGRNTPILAVDLCGGCVALVRRLLTTPKGQ